jgi:hypothetical protein
MLSLDLFRVIVAERERDLQESLRARRLLGRERPEPSDPTTPAREAGPQVPPTWRASTPPARATTR